MEMVDIIIIVRNRHVASYNLGRGKGTFGDKEQISGTAAYVIMHIVKRWLLKWCLLEFLEGVKTN